MDLLPRDWRLSDEEFQAMKQFFDHKPEHERSPEAVREQLAVFDRDMQNILQEREPQWQIAICILIQGRNFLARYIGEKEMAVPVECYDNDLDEQPAADPIATKHIAVYTPLDYVGQAACLAIGAALTPSIAFELYRKPADLLQAVLDGNVCGIVALHGSNGGSVLGTLRHDFKNLRGRTYEEAQRYLFPPCADFSAAQFKIGELVRIVGEMSKGAYQADAEQFDLASALPTLGVHMLMPSRDLDVAIVDDEPDMAEGMRRILEAWPRVTPIFVHAHGAMPSVPPSADIVLLDEAMPAVSGEDVYAALRSRGFEGIVASISGGERPAWCRHHFQQKDLVKTSPDAAKAFVHFMNGLIRIA